LKKVAVLQRSDNRINPNDVFPLLDKLISLGCQVVMPKSLCEFYPEYKNSISFFDLPLKKDMADMLIVLGGDGSIISVARENAECEIPIVGINFGTLGYMTELESSELSMLERILSDEARIEERMMLEVSIVRGNDVITTKKPSLNDIVLSNGPIPRILSFDLYANGSFCQSYSADGIIIATPTGSTAYSMSAGGPVVDPTLSCIIATPTCPHSIGQQPVIFSGDTELEINNLHCRANKIYLSVDGNEFFEIQSSDRILIKKSHYITKLQRIKKRQFISVLNEKMGKK